MHFLCNVSSILKLLTVSPDDCFAACKLSMRRVSAPRGWSRPVGKRPSRAKRVPSVARLCTVYWLVLVPFISSLWFEIGVYADKRLSKSAKAFSIASTWYSSYIPTA